MGLRTNGKYNSCNYCAVCQTAISRLNHKYNQDLWTHAPISLRSKAFGCEGKNELHAELFFFRLMRISKCPTASECNAASQYLTYAIYPGQAELKHAPVLRQALHKEFLYTTALLLHKPG
jgi:hypothetical protein